MRTGVTNDEPEGHGWAYVPGLDGQWEQITLGENGHLWMLRQNQVYRYTSELQEPSHKAITGHNIKQVNCGNWMLVTVTIFNEVYERTDYNGDAPANLDGTSWRQIKGSMNYVASAEQGVVWGLDKIGDIWILNTGTISDEVIIENETMGWVLVNEAHLV
jgi:hypothetical protein